MQLYIIRHCESENNALWKHTGSSNGRLADPLLTELGHQQAQELAKYLKQQKPAAEHQKPDIHNRQGYGFTHLYCSLMIRAIQTGSYISEALELPLVAWEPIHERGGIYLRNPETDEIKILSGANRTKLADEYPYLVLPEALDEQGWWNRPYEDREAARLRAQQVINELWERHGNSEDRVAIVSHGGFFQSLLSVFFDATFSPPTFDKERELWIKMNNGSISRFDFYDRAFVVSYLNRIEFMPTEMIT